jgi:hypothetical protein
MFPEDVDPTPLWWHQVWRVPPERIKVQTGCTDLRLATFIAD